MDTKFNGLPNADRGIVYVRPVAVSSLPDDLRAQIGQDLTRIYAVSRPDGEQVALVADRNMAFAFARHHDLSPVSVH